MVEKVLIGLFESGNIVRLCSNHMRVNELLLTGCVLPIVNTLIVLIETII